MIRALLIFLALNTVVVYLVHQILDNFIVSGGAPGFVLVGVVIGLLNLFLKPILKVLSLPFIFLTVGLFVILINGFILWVSQQIVSIIGISNISLTIDGIGTYMAAVFLFGILNYLFHKLIR